MYLAALHAWILGFMIAVAAPGRTTYYTEAQESQAEAMARYDSIAQDLVDVVYDPATTPLFKGPDGRSRTVTILLSLALYESGFMKNVDQGVGKFARGDHGNSWCLLQLNVGSGRTIRWNAKFDRAVKYTDDPADIVEGFTGPEMVQDRKKCFIAGLRNLRSSFNSCRGLPFDQSLRAYGSGSCEKGGKASAVRMHTAMKFWDQSKAARTWSDDDIVQILAGKMPDPVEEPAKVSDIR